MKPRALSEPEIYSPLLLTLRANSPPIRAAKWTARESLQSFFGKPNIEPDAKTVPVQDQHNTNTTAIVKEAADPRTQYGCVKQTKHETLDLQEDRNDSDPKKLSVVDKNTAKEQLSFHAKTSSPELNTATQQQKTRPHLPRSKSSQRLKDSHTPPTTTFNTGCAHCTHCLQAQARIIPAQTLKPTTTCTKCAQPSCPICLPEHKDVIVKMEDYPVSFTEEWGMCTLCIHSFCTGSELRVIHRCGVCGHEGCACCQVEWLVVGKEEEEGWAVCCRCEKMEEERKRREREEKEKEREERRREVIEGKGKKGEEKEDDSEVEEFAGGHFALIRRRVNKG